MDEGKSWLRTHWRTAVVLAVIFGLALFIRVYFVYGLAFPGAPSTCDANYVSQYSGGSDSYYWDRALCYSLQTGKDRLCLRITEATVELEHARPFARDH